MKKNLIFIFILTLINSGYSQISSDSIFLELNKALIEKKQYTSKKEERLEKLKSLKTDLSLIQQYDLNYNLGKEYRKFQLDSAICYAKQNLQIAESLNRIDLKNTALIQLIPFYSSTGLYREAEDILNNLNRKKLEKDLLPDYYEAYSQFYSHYAANHKICKYTELAEIYRDSLISVLDSSSIRCQINIAEKKINLGQIDNIEDELFNMLAFEDEDTQNYAMISYLLACTYKIKKNEELEKKYFAISAISDIKSSNKDNASIQHLALIYFKSGDIDNAYKCTTSAIEDAIFCNVQFRTLRMSEVFNIINSAYQDKENKSKSQLKLFLLLISILSIFLTLAMIYVYLQMKRLSRIKEELSHTTKKLAELNKDISKTNEQLQQRNGELAESNHIKEEYIANFFDICSTYINKLENYRKTLNKKALAKEQDELYKMLKSTTLVENELEDLYKTFDNIFLNLYPSFVKEFNELLIPEEQIVLKQGELLNTELRIFALIRLGITDSVKIAAFLRYSLSTIYNYRTRARNKAAVSRNEFEEMIMEIGTMAKESI